MALIDGVKINLGGTDYEVPPLNFKSVKRIFADGTVDVINGVKGMPTGDQLDVMTALVHTALVRNYPDLKLEEVEEMLDLRNVMVAIRAIMGASGLDSKDAVPEGEGKARP